MRPSEAITQIYELKRARDIQTPSAMRTIELKVQAINMYLDKLWEKTPALFLSLLLLCQTAFAAQPIEKDGDQINISHKDQTLFRTFFDGRCYKKPERAFKLPDGDFYIDFEIDPVGCTEATKKPKVVTT